MSMRRRLTSQEREELVSDLYYNQNKTYREITKIAKICPRDIKSILDKDIQSNQAEQSMSESSKAYELFDEGKSPLQVAIALNLREDKVTQYYKEFWDLRQLFDFNKIYLETNGDLGFLVRLYKLSKASGLSAEHVVRLITIANDDLPSIEYRYQVLRSEVASLKAKKQSLVKISQGYNNQVTALGKKFDYFCSRCEQQATKLDDLQRKRSRLMTLVRYFENNNEEYGKITKTVEEKVSAFLSSRKRQLELAALSVIESIRKNPEKYTSLVQQNPFSTMDYTSLDFNPYFMYGQQPPQQQVQSKAYFTEDYVAMISEDADKLLEKLVKDLGDEILGDFIANPSRPSLPLLRSSNDASNSTRVPRP